MLPTSFNIFDAEELLRQLNIKTVTGEDDVPKDFYTRWALAMNQNFNLNKKIKPHVEDMKEKVNEIAEKIDNRVNKLGNEAANKIALAIFASILGIGLIGLTVGRNTKQTQKNNDE